MISATKAIRATGLFADECSLILGDLHLEETHSDSLRFDKEETTKIKSTLHRLQSKCNTTIEALLAIDNTYTEHTIEVRLPETTSIADCAKYVETLGALLEQALSCDPINDRPVLTSFDRGSLWLNILVATKLGQSLITFMMRITHEHLERKLKNAALLELLKDARSRRDFNEKIRGGLEQTINSITNIDAPPSHQAVGEALSSDGIKITDPESIGRVALSIKKLITLTEKGLEVHPALLEPANRQVESFKAIEISKLVHEIAERSSDPAVDPESESSDEIAPRSDNESTEPPSID